MLNYFWGLSALTPNERVEAAASLVRALLVAQQAFEDAAAKVGAAGAAAASASSCNDVAYAVKRLVRGLASSRAGSRQGFALALTEVLQAFPNAVRTETVITELAAATQTSQKSSRTEIGDALLGRVFGTLALQRAGRLSGDPAMTGSGGSASPLVRLADDLFRAASKQHWVAPIAFEALGALVGGAGSAAWRGVLAPTVLLHLGDDMRAWSPEQLSLALCLDSCLDRWRHAGEGGEDVDVPQAISSLRAALEPTALSRFHLTGTLGDDRSDSGDGNDDGSPLVPALLSSTTVFPLLHTVWGRLFERYVGGALVASTTSGSADGAASPRGSITELGEVWRVGVDEALLAAGPERKATALALLVALLPRVRRSGAGADPARVVGALLSQHLVRAITRSAGNKKKLLHASARGAIDALLAACAGCPPMASAAVVCLLVRGHPNFDAHTGVPAVATLLRELDEGSVAAHVAAALAEFVTPSAVPIYADLASTVSAGLLVRRSGGLAGPLTRGVGEDAAAADDGTDSVAAWGGPLGGDGDEAGDDDVRRRVGRSPADIRRIWALDTISSAVRNPSLPALRTRAALLPLVATLAVHAFADVDVPEPTWAELRAADAAEAAGAAPMAVQASSKKSKRRANGAGSASFVLLRRLLTDVGIAGNASIGAGSLESAARLVVANPPLSPGLRAELRTRILTLIRDLAAAAHVAAHGGKGAPHNASTTTTAAAAATTPVPTGADLNANVWESIKDGAAGAAHLVATLTQTVGAAWDAAVTAAAASVEAASSDADAVAVTAHPHAAALTAAIKDDDDDDDDDDDGEGAAEGDDNVGPTALTPAIARVRCNEASTALAEMGSFLMACASAQPPHSGATSDAARALAASQREAARTLLSYAAALSHASLLLLLEAPTGEGGSESNSEEDDEDGDGGHDNVSDGHGAAVSTNARNKAVADATVAVADMLRAMRTLLQPAALVVQNAAAAVTAAVSAPPAPKSSKKAGKSVTVEVTPDAKQLTPPPSALAAVSTLRTLSAPIGADDDVDDEAADAPDAVLVFTDAALALLANSSAGLRDAIKTAARGVYGGGRLTAAAVDALLAVVTARNDADEGDDGDGDADRGAERRDGDHAGASDSEESIMLDDAGGALGMLIGGAGDDAVAAARARAAERSSDSSDDDTEASSSDEEDGTPAEPGAAEAEMARYDMLLGNMLRIRRSARRAAGVARTRALHFKYRALELLDVAVTRASASAGASAASRAVALGLPLQLLRALRALASRARHADAIVAGRGGAVPASASSDRASAAALHARLHALLSRALRDKPPAGTADDARATDSQLAALGTVVTLAMASPTADFADAAASVAAGIVRSLRLTSTAPAPSQPPPALLTRLAAVYTPALDDFTTARHSRIGPSFYRHLVEGTPALAVRVLLPALGEAIARSAMAKAFRIAEAFVLIGTVLKACAARGVADLLCCADVESSAFAAPKKSGKNRAAAVTAVVPPVTIGAYVASPAVVRPLLEAIAATLAAAAASGTAPSISGVTVAADAPRLNAKQMREPLALLLALLESPLTRRTLLGSDEGATNTDPGVVKTLGAALDAAATLAQRAGGDVSEGVRRGAEAVLLAAGRRIDGSASSAVDGESDAVVEETGVAMTSLETVASESSDARAAKSDKKAAKKKRAREGDGNAVVHGASGVVTKRVA